MTKSFQLSLVHTLALTILVGGVACSSSAQQAVTAPVVVAPAVVAPAMPSRALTGKDALGDWTTDAPGVRRKITLPDLPAAYDTPSVDNGPRMIPAPDGAMPRVPAGFAVEKWATNLNNPRKIVTAPNGDLFIAESGPGQIRILRKGADGKPVSQIFGKGLNKPFGIAFYPAGPNPQYIYIGDTDAVVRFPYKSGDLLATGAFEKVCDLPGGGLLRGGGHWTRDVAFSADGKRMWVSVGSHSNVSDDAQETNRADILEFTPDGQNQHIYAGGIRNAVGIAVQPGTGTLWMSVNERDNLGDHLVPDYISHVEEGAFYGWPWYYMGSNQDPRHPGKRPDLAGKVMVPDVLLQSHMASLALTFYTGSAFPAEYKNTIFAAEHGSWNRARRTGYKVIRVPLEGGKATGEYEDFLTGFVTPDGNVWGRPVGVTTGNDGALYVTDDGSNTVWRVSYTGASRAKAVASR